MLPLIPATPRPSPIPTVVDHMRLSDSHVSASSSLVNTTAPPGAAIEATAATTNAAASATTNAAAFATTTAATTPSAAVPTSASTTTSAAAPPTEIPSNHITTPAFLRSDQLHQDLLVRPTPTKDKPLVTGTVDWFDAQKGYGFVKSPACDRDIFAHQSQIIGTGYRRLLKGQMVEFILTRDHVSANHSRNNVVGKNHKNTNHELALTLSPLAGF